MLSSSNRQSALDCLRSPKLWCIVEPVLGILFSQAELEYLGPDIFCITALQGTAHIADLCVDVVLHILGQLVLVLPQAGLSAVDLCLSLILGLNTSLSLQDKSAR